MEIYQLRTFLAVARCGNLTRAAEQLFISQPAVSKQIKALEDELAVSLFDRLPVGVALTKAGRELRPFCERIVDDARQLTDAAAQFRGELTGTIRLGTIIDPESIRLGNLLARMLEAYPHIDITLHHGISGNIRRGIEDGELDAGFYLGDLNDPAIEVMVLRNVRYVVIAPLSYSEWLQDAEIASLQQLPWIGPNVHSSQHRLLSHMFASAGLQQPDKVVNVDQESSMIDLVRNGVGVCLMREEIIEAHAAQNELLIWDKAMMNCPLSFLYLRERAGEAQIKAIRDAVARQYDKAAIPT